MPQQRHREELLLFHCPTVTDHVIVPIPWMAFHVTNQSDCRINLCLVLNLIWFDENDDDDDNNDNSNDAITASGMKRRGEWNETKWGWLLVMVRQLPTTDWQFESNLTNRRLTIFASPCNATDQEHHSIYSILILWKGISNGKWIANLIAQGDGNKQLNSMAN